MHGARAGDAELQARERADDDVYPVRHSTLDFTAQGTKEGDEVLRAQISRMREP